MRLGILIPALVMLWAATADAASILAWDVGELTVRSDLVVLASVDSVRGERLEDGELRTVNTLTVLDAFKGDAKGSLRVVQGSARVGDVVKTIHGDMELAPGGRYVLFLSERDGELHSTLLGWSVFAVDGAGDDAALTRNLGGLALYRRAPDGDLQPASEIDVAAATPRTLGALQREVEAAR